MLLESDRRFARMKNMIRVNTMDDVDVMAGVAQSMAQTVE